MPAQTKKVRNSKNVKVNNRNRRKNLYYLSPIRTLSKKFYKGLKVFEVDSPIYDINSIARNLISLIDKAVKKNVLHKNTAARKKSRIAKTLKKKFL